MDEVSSPIRPRPQKTLKLIAIAASKWSCCMMLCSLYIFVLLNFTDSLWQCSVLFSHIFWKIWKSLFGLGPAVCLWSGHRSDEHCWLDSYVAPYADLDVFTLPSGGVNGDETHDAIYYAMHAATKDAIRPCKSILIVHYPCRSSCRWQSFQHSLYRQSRQNCTGAKMSCLFALAMLLS